LVRIFLTKNCPLSPLAFSAWVNDAPSGGGGPLAEAVLSVMSGASGTWRASSSVRDGWGLSFAMWVGSAVPPCGRQAPRRLLPPPLVLIQDLDQPPPSAPLAAQRAPGTELDRLLAALGRDFDDSLE
jgi:hypothetical protein